MSTIQKLYSQRKSLPSPFDKNVYLTGPFSGDNLGKSYKIIGGWNRKTPSCTVSFAVTSSRAKLQMAIDSLCINYIVCNS
jgi:hypothetical protein